LEKYGGIGVFFLDKCYGTLYYIVIEQLRYAFEKTLRARCDMENREKKVLVIGVIGADVHAVGNKILYHAFTEAGFEVVNLGVMVAQEEYIAAAIESGADAIVVSSLYGQGELDCRGLREKCDEAGLKGIPLVVGGNIVIGKQKFDDVERRFKDMGFDRAFPPGTTPETTIEALRELLHMDGEQK
jgi:methylaspartate mutase sigma subunit